VHSLELDGEDETLILPGNMQQHLHSYHFDSTQRLLPTNELEANPTFETTLYKGERLL
jgi:hypothetical protein